MLGVNSLVCISFIVLPSSVIHTLGKGKETRTYFLDPYGPVTTHLKLLMLSIELSFGLATTPVNGTYSLVRHST